MSATNSFIGKNYFEGDVQMPVPPEYFLQRVYDYDVMLVMFPSQARPGGYVLARRREKTAGITDEALKLVVNPDTRTCVVMGWVPVCMVFQTGISWDADPLIAKLKARDLWAHGGAEKVAALLEQQEVDEEVARKKAVRDDLWNRSGDGWRTYQARTGASSIKFHDRQDSPVTDATDSTASTPRSTAGLGA